ncbi:MAG: chemotaxis protein CheW [Phycisphaerales bacterium JB039]
MPRSGSAQREIQLIAFEVGAEELALDVEMVERIGPLTGLNGGGAHGPVAGCAPCAGAMVPVLSLRACLGLPAAEATEAGRIIFLAEGGRVVGLAVDRVCEVLRLSADMLTPGGRLPGAASAWIAGSVQLEDRTLTALDGAAILAGLPGAIGAAGWRAA